MNKQIEIDYALLDKLNETIEEAVSLFSEVDDDLCDGNQSARAVLSHLLFWHLEYAAVAEALVEGHQPVLREGAFSVLNAQATRLYQYIPLPELADWLLSTQERLDAALRLLPDWSVNFPVKAGGRFWNVADRLETIESHIRNHVGRLRRLQRRSPAWREAYNQVKV
jgi:hypothetical protein